MSSLTNNLSKGALAKRGGGGRMRMHLLEGTFETINLLEGTLETIHFQWDTQNHTFSTGHSKI